MGIIDELDKLVIREDDDDFEERGSVERIASRIDGDEEEAGVDDVIKHLDAVKAAAEYMDSIITDEADNATAFEAERALRDAIEKMEELSKEVYKSKAKAEKSER